ncbi:MAG: N-acetyltransferase family protein [Candidatus Rariloculaceae bacterium]
MIRPANTDDVERIASLYNYYVANTIATFEEEPVTVAEMQTRLTTVITSNPWFVAEEEGSIVGYAYAGQFERRASYRHSVETSVYLDRARVGNGFGMRLYTALLGDLRARGRHCAIGRIALPNDASIALHERLGFENVAHLREIGFKFNQWIDVGYWELLL